MEWIYEDGMYVTEMEFEAFFRPFATKNDRSRQNG